MRWKDEITHSCGTIQPLKSIQQRSADYAAQAGEHRVRYNEDKDCELSRVERVSGVFFTLKAAILRYFTIKTSPRISHVLQQNKNHVLAQNFFFKVLFSEFVYVQK